MKKLNLIFLLTASALSLSGQDTGHNGVRQEEKIAVTGKVKDIASGESLPAASVVVKGTGQGTATNADGFFTLKNTPSDTTTLVISYIGYTTYFLKLNPTLAKNFLVIELTPLSHELSDVVILGEYEGLLQANQKIGTIKLTPAGLTKLPNLGERDIMRAFQLMPGVSAANESSSGLYVRGGTPDQNLIVYDGFTIYHVDHLYGFFSAFNANAIKDVQLYKSGFPVRYGGRLSSVMEVTGKDGNSNKISVGTELSLLSMNFFLEVPLGKKFTSLFAYRRSWRGPLHKKIFDLYQTESDSDTPPAGPGPIGPGRFGGTSTNTVQSFFYDLNAKLSFRPGEKDIISVSLFNGTDKLDNGQDIQPPSRPGGGGPSVSNVGFDITDLTRYGNSGTSIKWSRQWNKNLYSNTTMGYSNYFSERDRTSEASFTSPDGDEMTVRNGTLEDNDLTDLSFKSDIVYDLYGKHLLGVGIFGNQFKVSYTYSQSDTATILDRHNTGKLLGGYFQDEMSLMQSRLQIVPGVRVSHFDITSKTYIEPRLSASYMINKRLKIYAAAGKFYQFANRVIREDILAGSRDFWVLSDDKNVPVSSSYHYNVGTSLENNNYLFSIEAYRKNYYNLSEYSLRFMPQVGEIVYNEYFYNGDGYSNGLEFLVQRKSGKINGWVSYTLAESQNQFDVYGRDYFPASQDVRHEFKTVAIAELARWNISFTWIFATGRPYTAPQGGYKITLLDGSTRDYIAVGPKNGQRLPDYHRLDFAVSYTLLNKKGDPAGNLGFSIFNIYNRRNVWYKEFNISDGSIIESNIQYLGVTPNISLSIKIR